MDIFENVVRSLLNENTVSVSDVEKAIENHNRIIIDYNSKGDPSNSGARVIEVYAYGLTKAGNPCIRAFQPYGQTTSRVPSWKFFRLDRISAWKPTKQIFNRPADFYYQNIGDFNPNGDETMSIVYKIAQFGEEEKNIPQTPSSQPKTKQDVFKTDTEYRMERLKQQLDNPITLSDIKTGDAFKQFNNDTPIMSGPKTKQDVQEPSTQNQEDIYKTDTERGMDRLSQQLQNPQKIDLTQFERKPKSQQEKEKELQKLRQTLSDKPISLSDLNKKMKEETPQEPSTQNQEDIYKTDTERGMDRLSQQLQNPQKIDLSRIPKR